MSWTQQQKRNTGIAALVLVLLAFVAFAYFKWIKPAQDKKREEKRKAETDIIQQAQPANTGVNPAQAPVAQSAPTGLGTQPAETLSGRTVYTPPPIATNTSPVGIGGGSTTLSSPSSPVGYQPVATSPTISGDLSSNVQALGGGTVESAGGASIEGGQLLDQTGSR